MHKFLKLVPRKKHNSWMVNKTQKRLIRRWRHRSIHRTFCILVKTIYIMYSISKTFCWNIFYMFLSKIFWIKNNTIRHLGFNIFTSIHTLYHLTIQTDGNKQMHQSCTNFKLTNLWHTYIIQRFILSATPRSQTHVLFWLRMPKTQTYASLGCRWVV